METLESLQRTVLLMLMEKLIQILCGFLLDKWNDYALVKFAFNKENKTLQDYTGGLGWRIYVGNNTLTNIFGYPLTCNLENCIKDGKHLCEWEGYTQIEQEDLPIDYVISGSINLGKGVLA
ncbi:hypothetical protein C2G38_2036579 [Gigaspora rosea]|uniref:Uncharacterized protein n=1 Tax=Gigaspora rosea TaxID=44941 RepID=A0A397VBY2_9GLOM|nr:hypothetical protein C2G38_2036579 [Gigaspora rosea]